MTTEHKPTSSLLVRFLCRLGFHDVAWDEYALWLRHGICRRCGRDGWDVLP